MTPTPPAKPAPPKPSRERCISAFLAMEESAARNREKAQAQQLAMAGQKKAA